MIIYAESNFLLELALWQEQHGACLSLLHYAGAERAELAVPAFCIGECFEKLGRLKARRLDIQVSLRSEIRELERSAPSEALSTQLRILTDSLVAGVERNSQEYDKTVATLLALGAIIPLDASVIEKATDLRTRFALSPQDAVVLASVLIDLERRQPQEALFVNRNRKDFENPDIRMTLAKHDCELKTDFNAGLAYFESHLRALQS